MLNPDFINDMFDSSPPREDVSLNYTASSRSSKHQKKQPQPHPKEEARYERAETAEIVDMAAKELQKFHLWLQETETNYSLNHEGLNQLIEEIELAQEEEPRVDDLMVIKEELFRREQDDLRAQDCQECAAKDKEIQELQQLNDDQDDILAEKGREVAEMKEQMLQQALMETKQYLLAGVENNLLKCDIRDLHSEINALRNEKITLQRTFLFNKTRNSQITNLQKSKDLSAAKNSTNSSEILNRNHETIVFIDPIESDVQEWIKFFQTQKNRYRILSKKESEERQKDLGRAFTKEEREGFENEDKVCILFNSIKEILKNLLRIRENTTSFQQTDTMGKSALREKTLKNSDQDLLSLKQQFQKLHIKFNKLVKINEYLVREKQNLQDINSSLKQERLKENNERNTLSEAIKREAARAAELVARVREYEQNIAHLKSILAEKQEQLLYFFEEMKTMKKMYPNLSDKYKLLEKRYKEIEIENMSFVLRLKREAMEKKRIYNEMEDLKGAYRIYCRIKENSSSIIENSINAQTNPSLFHRLITDHHSQEKLHEDARRLILNAFDNFHFTVFNYGQNNSGKGSFLYGDEQSEPFALNLLNELFKLIDTEKEIKIEVAVCIFEFYNDKLTDLMDGEKGSKAMQVKQDALDLLSQYEVRTAKEMQERYSKALQSRKTKEKSQSFGKSHLIIRVNLTITNSKTNEKQYKSNINLIDLADDPSPKNLSSLSKCLSAFSNKEKMVPYRQNKLTQLLKDSFNTNNKIFMILNLSSSMSREQIKQALSFAEATKCAPRREDEQPSKARRSISRKNI